MFWKARCDVVNARRRNGSRAVCCSSWLPTSYTSHRTIDELSVDTNQITQMP